MQPGDTITPQNAPEDKDAEVTVPLNNPEPATSDSNSAQADPAPQAQHDSPIPSTADNSVVSEPSPWQYSAGDEVGGGQLPVPNTAPVSWTASEFVDNEKNAGWFMGLAGLTVLAVIAVYLITHDLITAVVIIIAAVLFGVTAKRKPRTLQYQLDNSGVNIGGKPYPYELFKSFAVLAEGAFNSIQLMPLKRFMPPISLYYPPESEEQIITTLGSYLPHEDRTHDPLERLMRRVRF